jgi:predicted DNA-binding protein (UPF0251 family)
MQNTITHEEAIEMLRRLVDEEGSQTQAAAKLGISSGYLSEILANGKPISDKVAKALGYEKIVLYKQIAKGK